jgi:hypothetical protein
LSDDSIRHAYLANVYRRISETIKTRSKGSRLVNHALETGLSNEEILRDSLREILPSKYGVAKGKIVNASGAMSRQCDIILYDVLNCPNIFVDSNKNQILPIEGVYAVIEVKTQLTHAKLAESFENISSSKNLTRPLNVSTNDHVKISPPLGYVIAYDDKRSLESIYDDYVKLNESYHPKLRSLSYDKKSPASKGQKSRGFVIDDVLVVDKGEVFYMYNGIPVMIQSSRDALADFITTLISHLDEMRLPVVYLRHYLGEMLFLYDRKTKIGSKFLRI